MIENKSLRIGNKLQKDNGEVFTVLRIDATNDVLVEEQRGLLTLNYNLFGIPITDDLLICFGFKKTIGYGFKIFGNWLQNEDDVYWYNVNGNFIQINFVHQLQNLCFALTNKELKINKQRMKLLDFNNEEKGYEKFYPSRENIRKNIGKKICFVTYIDPHIGYYNVKYGVIDSVRYSRLLLNGGNDDVDIRDIIEAGIKIED